MIHLLEKSLALPTPGPRTAGTEKLKDTRLILRVLQNTHAKFNGEPLQALRDQIMTSALTAGARPQACLAQSLEAEAGDPTV